MKDEKSHLPLYGVGPLYVAVVVGLTVIGIVLSVVDVLPTASPEPAALPCRILGIILAAGGVALWVAAVIGAKIDANIEENNLVTSGVYAIVRNPVYSAFMIVCTGAILICGNLWLLVLIPIFWIFMTVLMKRTEEKWLSDLYGSKYADYCRRTNRCIPWFPKK